MIKVMFYLIAIITTQKEEGVM